MRPVVALLGGILSLVMPIVTGVGFGVMLAMVVITMLTHGGFSISTRILIGAVCIAFVIARIRLLRSV